MQAIGHQMLLERPNAKVVYIQSETFVNDFINSIKNKTQDQFREKYRTCDLLLVDDIQFFAKKELADFFEEQIDRIGRAQVKLKPITFKEVLVPEDDSVEKTEIVASMRIDAVLSGISKQSRGQVQKMISSQLVKLNWHDATDSNIMVKENDVLSLRHFGRILIEDVSATRKGKYKVVLKLWQTKKRN